MFLIIDRDLSWLSFNERILQQAGSDTVPVMERVNFLAIFSSNLDEFYRVRMPVLFAMDKLGKLEVIAGVIKDPLSIAQRYLEHGRVFIFHNNNDPEVYLGSADWMNRNIYRRIEVCFPIYDEQIKEEIIAIVNLQLQDNVQAVWLNEKLENIKVETAAPAIQSQHAVYGFLNQKAFDKKPVAI